MSQTTQPSSRAIAVEGMIADAGNNDIISVIAHETIPFGRFVTVQTNGDPPKAKLPAASGDVTGPGALGVALFDASKVSGAYAAGEMVPVLRRGRVYVKSEDAVTNRVDACVRFTADANPVGQFRTDTDAGEAVALPGASLLTPCSAGALTVAEINYQS